MPRESNFDLVNKFSNYHDFIEYKQANHNFSTDKSNKVNCTICNEGSHSMKAVYSHCVDLNCNSKDEMCPVRYRTFICLKHDNPENQKIFLYKLTGATHLSGNCQKSCRGLSEKVKEIVEDLIFNYESKPKRIQIKLQKKKFKPKIDFMPTLKQI